MLLLTATPVNLERHLGRVEREGADPFPVLDRALVRGSRSDLMRAHEEARSAGVPVEALAATDRLQLDLRREGGHELLPQEPNAFLMSTRAADRRPGRSSRSAP